MVQDHQHMKGHQVQYLLFFHKHMIMILKDNIQSNVANFSKLKDMVQIRLYHNFLQYLPSPKGTNDDFL